MTAVGRRGRALRRRRETLGISQAALGRDVGVSDTQIRQFEIGRRPLPLPLKVAIAKRVGLPLSALLDRDEMATVRAAAELLAAESAAA